MSDNKVPVPSDYLGPQPQQTNLDANIEKAADPQQLSFDPVALRERYKAERDKRLNAGLSGINQYKYVEGQFAHMLKDPWVEPGFTRDSITETVDVIVIGGGYGAQLVAVRLIESGITNVRMIEKAGGFGGTWYWNRYPGAQCDIESYIYMPLLEELNYVPTEKYAHAKELLEHADRIGRHWNLYDRALFQTEVYECRWDDNTNLWTVKTDRGDTIRCHYLIPAAGPLHRPKLPGTPGITSFKGHTMHSSRWDYHYSGGGNLGSLEKLKDKRVGIIGTGATAVQIVPHVGKSAKELYVFQRTPSSIDVRGNRPTDPDWAASLKPGWQKHRMDNFNAIVHGEILEEDLVSDGWTDILQKLLARMTPDMDFKAIEAERQLADFEKMNEVRARCDAIVKDPATAHNLKPWYNQLCKRPCFHDEYLDTYNLPSVHLIHTDGKGIDSITEKGIVANGKEYELDCIVYCTGFELATEWSHKTGMEIYGRNGVTITEKWKQGARTLHGWTTRDFPNCFWLQIVQAALSPNFLHVTGEQAEHMAYVMAEMKRRGFKTVEPTAEAEDDWVQTIVTLAELRRPFLEECTPGYYNNEGTPNPSAAQNASYGAGAVKFLELMRTWRAENKLEGLDLKPEKQANL